MKAMVTSAVCLALLLGQANSASAQPGPATPSEPAAEAPSNDAISTGTATDSAQPGPSPQTTPAQGTTSLVEAGGIGWPGPVPTAFLGNSVRLTPEQIAAWSLQPRGLLNDNPRGGGQMLKFVRSLIGSDSSTVVPLIDLVKMPDVTDAQVQTVADSFASVVSESEQPAPQYAAYIQWAVAQSGSSELIRFFEKSSGADDFATAAIGGLGSSPAASPGSGSLGGTGVAGVSGPIGGSSTVSSGAGVLGGSGSGGGSVSFNEDAGELLLFANGAVVRCTLQVSPAGCLVPLDNAELQ